MATKATPMTTQPQQGGYQQQGGYGSPPGHYGGQVGQAPGQYGVAPGQYGQPPPPGYAPQPGMPGQPMVPGGQRPPVQWMARPDGIPGCPPGLEYLTSIDQLLVQQQIELLEIMTGWETANKYVIRNSMGQQVYFAAEESDTCTRQCCGPQRSFVIHITDNTGQEVIRITREFKCCGGCCWCAGSDSIAHIVTVEAPVGQVVGFVRQMKSCMEPRFAIMDANQEVVLSVVGPTCIVQGPGCTQDQEFIVSSADGGTEVGKISKQWSGWVREAFTDADNFGISFPVDLDVKIKAVMIAGVFLIDFMYFEQNQNNNNRY